MSSLSIKLLFFVFSIVLPVIFASLSHNAKLKIRNLTPKDSQLFWVNAEKGTEKLIFSLPNENENNVDTFIGHKFRVKADSFVADFSITETVQSMVLVFNETSSALALTTRQQHEVEQTRLAMQTIRNGTKRPSTKQVVQEAVKGCESLRVNSDDYFKCVATGVKARVTEIEKSSSETTARRNALSTSLRNYTCKDPNLHTTPPISTELYSDPNFRSGEAMQVHTMLVQSNAKVWMVENFITEDECDVLIKHGMPRLARATVAGEDGSSVISENRKAQQAVYDSHKRNGEHDPLWPLFKRILAITNHRTGYGLQEDGQEHFAIIQYNPTDEYTPHCDGSCDGQDHLKGGRVATAVMYCKTAEKGGGTIFTNTNIHVKPRNNTVLFFSYRGEDKVMDPGRYTEHSGCPVEEGEKWIATFWMRDGVSKTDPWTNFDPNGRRTSPELTIDHNLTSHDTFSDSNETQSEMIEQSPSVWKTYAGVVDKFLIETVYRTFYPVTEAVFKVIQRVFYSTKSTARVYAIIEDAYERAMSYLFPENPAFMGSVLLTTVPVITLSLLLVIVLLVYLLGGCRKQERSHRLLFRPLDTVGPDDYHRVVAGGLADRTTGLPLAERLKNGTDEDAQVVDDAAALEEGRTKEELEEEEQVESVKPARRPRKSLTVEPADNGEAPPSKTPGKLATRRQGRTSAFANDESPFPVPVRRARSKTPGSTRKRS